MKRYGNLYPQIYDMDNLREAHRNGFTLTMDQPDMEYTGLRRPIIIPVKKLDIGPAGLADGWLQDLGELV